MLCCSALVRTDTHGVPGLAVYMWTKPAFFEDRKYCWKIDLFHSNFTTANRALFPKRVKQWLCHLTAIPEPHPHRLQVRVHSPREPLGFTYSSSCSFFLVVEIIFKQNLRITPLQYLFFCFHWTLSRTSTCAATSQSCTELAQSFQYTRDYSALQRTNGPDIKYPYLRIYHKVAKLTQGEKQAAAAPLPTL